MFHIAVKAGNLPFNRSLHEPVLDRVVMDILHVMLPIPVIPDQVLPEASLPDSPLSFRAA